MEKLNLLPSFSFWEERGAIYSRFIRCYMLTQTGSQTSGVYSTAQCVRVECQPFYPLMTGRSTTLIPVFFFLILFSPSRLLTVHSCFSSTDLYKNADRIVSSIIWHVSGTDIKGHSWYWQSWFVSIKSWTPINVPCGCNNYNNDMWYITICSIHRLREFSSNDPHSNYPLELPVWNLQNLEKCFHYTQCSL